MVKLIYTKTSSGKKKPKKGKKLEKAKAEHAKFLSKLGLSDKPKRKLTGGVNHIPDYKVDDTTLAKTSDQVPTGVTPVKDIFHDHLWKKGKTESAETMNEIQVKKSKVGPGYNKGGLVYQTGDIMDYKKVR